MRRLVVLVFLLGIATSIIAQAPTRLRAGLVTVEYQRTSVAQILDLITAKQGVVVQFAPDVDQEKLQKIVTFRATLMEMEDALHMLLRPSLLTFKVVNESTVQVVKEPQAQ